MMDHCVIICLRLQFQVFGRELRPGEFEQLSDAEQEQRSDQLMDVIKQQIQRRRREEMENSR